MQSYLWAMFAYKYVCFFYLCLCELRLVAGKNVRSVEGWGGISYPTNRAMGRNSLSLRYKLTFKQLSRMHSTHISTSSHADTCTKGKHTHITHTHTLTDAAVTLQHAFSPKDTPPSVPRPSSSHFSVNCIDGKKCVRLTKVWGNGIVYLTL